jgi:RNA 2',3'-cyclic 3'-phosphodiesterase
MTRTFIALEMNSALQRHLADVIRQVALALPGIRWVDPAGIHLTLAFLGELTDDQLIAAQEAAIQTTKRSAPFSYQLSRLGTFGSPRQPRVIWIGITEPLGMLQRVHQTLNDELLQRAFEVDTRPFAPHFTLARVKASLSSEEQRHLHNLLHGDQQNITTLQRFTAEHLVVMKSELLPTGARYTVLNSFKLELSKPFNQ